jgi:prevent-host-death family protein
MIKTLRESKAKLSELVERASSGEDVLITVRGKIKARLTRAQSAAYPASEAAWVEELRALQRSVAARKRPRLTIRQILEKDRKDRI